MKTFYYTINVPGHNGGWDTLKQHECIANTWKQFIDYCYNISYHFKTTIRACESKGYNNQGTYIQSDFMSI